MSPESNPQDDARQGAGQPDELLRRIGRQLASAFVSLLGPSGAGVRRPTELSRRWGLEQTLCTRLYQAMRESDPLRVLRRSPGVPSLRAVLDAAARERVDPEKLSSAQTALSELEELIHFAGGTKTKLDTLAARHCRDSRERIERNAKQQVFRGMSSLLGVHATTSIVQVWVFPGDRPDRCHELVVHGLHRLTRLRPELPVLLGVRVCEPDEGKEVVLEALLGETLDQSGRTATLREFCSDPLPPIRVKEERSKLLYLLEANPGEFPQEVDLFFASIERNSEHRRAVEGHPRARSAFIPQTPVEHGVFDVYVHRDLWPGVEPELVLLRNGDARSPDLMVHSLDRVDFVESLQSLGSSPANFVDSSYSRLVPLCDSIYRQLEMPRDAFRLYRCSVRYPVFRLWYTIQFPLPR